MFTKRSPLEKIQTSGTSEINARSIRLKKVAIACLVVLGLYICIQLFNIYRTGYELTGPLVPESLIHEIDKQFIFKAALALAVLLIALALYHFKRHLLVIVLVILNLVASRYIYI